MARHIRSRIAAVPAASPAAIMLFLAVVLGPILVFAVAMRLAGG